MIRIKLIFSIMLLLFFKSISAQLSHRIDSLNIILLNSKTDSIIINTYIELGNLLIGINPDSAIENYNYAIKLINNNLLEKTQNTAKYNFDLTNKKANVFLSIAVIYHKRSDFDNAMKNYYESLVILRNLKPICSFYDCSNIVLGLGSCFNGLGGISWNKGQYKVAINYFQIAINNYEKQIKELEASKQTIKEAYRFWQGISNFFNNIGLVYKDMGSYDKAIEHYLKALKIDQYLSDSENAEIRLAGIRGKSLRYNNMGVVNHLQNNFDIAIEYFEKSIEIKKGINDLAGISSSYNGIGGVHWSWGSSSNNKEFRIEMLNKAIEYYEKSLTIKFEIGDKKGIATSYNNIGLAYKDLGISRKALYYYSKSLSITQEIGDKNGLTAIYSNISDLYINIADSLFNDKRYLLYIDSSLVYGKKSLDIATTIGAIPWQINSSNNLKNAYSRLGKYEKNKKNYVEASKMFQNALKYSDIYNAARDSMLNSEKIKAITEAEKKFEAERKELIIDKLKKQKEIDDKSIEFQRIIILLIALGSLLVLSIIILIFRNNQNKEKQAHHKERLQSIINAQENERIRFARDIHDGIGQYFFGLKLSISRLEDKSIGEDTKQDIYIKTMKSIDEMQQEIRNISYSIMPPLLHYKGLLAVLEELIEKINNQEDIQIDLTHFDYNERLDINVEVSLYRIIQEIINNITKYAGASEILIQFTKHNKLMNVMIEDNGNGYNTELLDKSKGHGWKNIQSRLEMIKGTIEIDSKHGRKNTIVTINVPI